MYENDLAKIHEEGFKMFSQYAYKEAIKWIGSKHNNVITDLGCGPGDFLELFSDGDNILIGVDISPKMIELAETKIPKARLEVASVYDVAIEDSSLITAIGEVLNYIRDSENDVSLVTLFEKIYSRLLPTGIFMFDVMLESDELDRTYQIFHDTDNWTVLTDSKEDKDKKLVKRKIITFYKDGSAYAKNTETHYLRLHSEEKLKQTLEQTGFNLKVSERYEDFILGRGRKAFICQKD